IAPYIKENYPDADHFVIDKPYLAVALGINFIDFSQRTNWWFYEKPEEIPDDALFIFDQQYVPVQYGIKLERIRSENKLEEIKEWVSPDGLRYVLFKKKKA